MDQNNKTGNFTNSDYFDSRDPDFTLKRATNTLLVDSFKSNDAGKYFSVISEDENGKPNEIDINCFYKYKIRITYIRKHNEIEEVLITKYKYNRKKEFVYDDTEGIRLNGLTYQKIFGLFKFLSNLDLPSIDDGKYAVNINSLSIQENIRVLNTIAASKDGKKIIDLYFKNQNLDIPELIKKGLSYEKVKEKEQILTNFEKMIDNPKVKEVSEIQEFLKNNPWIFGPEYKELDFRDAGTNGKPDGRLLRIDGLSDILEVKLPTEELLRIDNLQRQYIAPKLSQSIGQLIGYLEYYYSNYREETDDKSKKEILTDKYRNYYKPKGILLIGRRSKEAVDYKSKTISAEPKNIRRLLSYFHWIEVITYDDLIERARNSLSNLLQKNNAQYALHQI